MTTVIIGGIEFDDQCPEDCPGKNETVGQGGLCHRCPLFNCTGEFILLRPEDYRPDWARAWREWFDSDKSGYPCLKLNREESK